MFNQDSIHQSILLLSPIRYERNDKFSIIYILFKIPNSRGHDYGWHLQTQLGREIKILQTRFDNQYKKHRSTDVLGPD